MSFSSFVVVQLVIDKNCGVCHPKEVDVVDAKASALEDPLDAKPDDIELIDSFGPKAMGMTGGDEEWDFDE